MRRRPCTLLLLLLLHVRPPLRELAPVRVGIGGIHFRGGRPGFLGFLPPILFGLVLAVPQAGIDIVRVGSGIAQLGVQAGRVILVGRIVFIVLIARVGRDVVDVAVKVVGHFDAFRCVLFLLAFLSWRAFLGLVRLGVLRP